MSDRTQESGRPARRRPPVPSLAKVTDVRTIPGGMVRVTVAPSKPVADMDLVFTDHYVKLLFPPAGASWSWNDADLDPATLRDVYPREEWPVMRTYTLRSWDAAANTLDIDFVVHGDTGLAGPWAATVEPGAVIGFAGPGGAWRPSPDHDRFVLVGDEAAAPAIFAAVEALPAGATAEVFVEEEDADHELEAPESAAEVTLHRVLRNGAVHGTELVRAVVDSGLAGEGRASWFVHGVAEMIRDMRRHLFVDNGIPKADVSISGYWRLGMVEDEWQASKREFTEEIEAAEAAALKS
ncbi:siderophore-interacting protein [Corynebacterium sp.]|jgi:NADPH-dependent ferric siderophore reductase|uniref:siderophore-interacting protein n=1 Tax=Corynebacterium sp. TaxID=1720 RepID=UPI0025C48C4B|nr:siderophore-interacting protein [Corynebacterium sp.]